MVDKDEAKVFYKITVEGVVQGVGFRPFVYRAATKFRINGSVRNCGGSVEIFAGGLPENVDAFYQELICGAPSAARVVNLKREHVQLFNAEGFAILPSERSNNAAFPIPDLPVCGECLGELEGENSRRVRHFFISCVNCGPRFSVMRELPYDRESTAMADFALCGECKREYNTPADRRFHAETVCCNDCGPTLCFWSGECELKGEAAFSAAVRALEQGKIVAIKGVGGFHLACLPHDEQAVRELRRIKGREQKPLAVMFSSVERARTVCDFGDAEAELLCSDARPIVPLPVRNANALAPSVLRGDANCGVFLPYTPLHILLLKRLGALVLTSANESGGAIIYMDGELSRLEISALGGVLTHDREIVRPLEDSVAQINCGTPQVLRRGRGLAPMPFCIKNEYSRTMLAVGGDLKSAFCIVKNDRAYVSAQYGDLEDDSVFTRFREGVADYSRILGAKPELVICDAHPGYFSSDFARSLGLPLAVVQHHFAHAASVLAEHEIYQTAVAAAFDGTGYGEDGNIWGGEILVCNGSEYKRAASLAPVKLLGGDSAAVDAKKTAACYLLAAGIGANEIDSRADVIKSALSMNINTFQYTGAGRLFDAVAVILGICERNSYEGQCACLLEQYAQAANVYTRKIPDILRADGMEINALALVREAHEWRGDPREFAYIFHAALANAVSRACEFAAARAGTKIIALSGGVFQNKLLSGLVSSQLEPRGFRVLQNRAVPPGDGGLSLGQAYIGGILCASRFQ